MQQSLAHANLRLALSAHAQQSGCAYPLSKNGLNAAQSLFALGFDLVQPQHRNAQRSARVGIAQIGDAKLELRRFSVSPLFPPPLQFGEGSDAFALEQKRNE